ncbi:MAG: hypothetical protein QXS85_00675 [Acidilobaceae archaeon]
MESEIESILRGRELTFREIEDSLRLVRDRRALRLALADLVRRKVVERKPSYESKRMVFAIKQESGGE